MMHTHNVDVVQIVDALPRYENEHQPTIDPDDMARSLSRMIMPMGHDNVKIALVAGDDERSHTAYAGADYDTRRIADRKKELMAFTWEMNEYIEKVQPKQVVLVSDNVEFAHLCQATARHTKLSLWANSATIPNELREFGFCPLEVLLPHLKVPRIDVRIDLENIFIGLVKRGWRPNMHALIGAIRQAVQKQAHGEVVSITGYADFDELNRHHGGPNINWQRELTMADAESRYVINQHGKNSADMKIAGDIRTVIEHSSNTAGSIDVIGLVTMDRDFEHVVKEVKLRGKKIIVLGLKDGLSQHLRNLEVCYLDEYLEIPKASAKTTQRTAQQPPPPQDAAFMMRVGHWMNRNHWRFVFRDKLEREFAAESAKLGKLIAEGWLSATPNSSFDAQGRARVLEPNPEHTAACAARYLAGWIPARVDFCLNRRAMPYVDTNFLANGMFRDKVLAEMGVGQTRPLAEGWLRLAASAELVEANEIEHPERPGKFITTWRLPEEAAPQSASTESAEPVGETESPTPPVAQVVNIRQAGPQLAHLRNLLTSGLDNNDVDSLLLDHFTEVYRRVESAGMKITKIQALLDYVERHNSTDKLLELIREKNPSLFEQPAEEAMAA